MSGFVGVLQTDGAPVERSQLERLTGTLGPLGPDGFGLFVRGAVGMGHARLPVHEDTVADLQPFELDGDVVVAHGRVDDRAALCETLGLSPIARPWPTDAELLLRAYKRFGESMVGKVLGEFSFAVWDARSRRLVLGRDALGVRPLYFAHRNESFVFSSSLSTIAAHPGVSKLLDERYLADFLVFDESLDPWASAFIDIRRLPRGKVLTVEARCVRSRTVWEFEPPAIVANRSEAELLEGLDEVLGAAVADRSRSPRVGLLQSGGVDSSTIASVLASVRPDVRAHAYTVISAGLYDDDEGTLAHTVARRYGFTQTTWPCDDTTPFDGEGIGPEPDKCIGRRRRALYAHIASSGPVLLSGIGGDEVSHAETAASWAKRVSLRGAASGVLASLRVGVRPCIGTGLLGRMRGAERSGGPRAVPTWIDPEFARRLQLADRARWAHADDSTRTDVDHPRARAVARLQRRAWSAVLDGLDAAVLGADVEVALPFLDRRVLAWFLALPAMPWCVDKYLLRAGLRRTLPAAIHRRPKTPVAVDAVTRWPRRAFEQTAELAVERLGGVVDGPKLLSAIRADAGGDGIWRYYAPLALGLWCERSYGGCCTAPISANMPLRRPTGPAAR